MNINTIAENIGIYILFKTEQYLNKYSTHNKNSSR